MLSGVGAAVTLGTAQRVVPVAATAAAAAPTLWRNSRRPIPAVSTASPQSGQTTCFGCFMGNLPRRKSDPPGDARLGRRPAQAHASRDGILPRCTAAVKREPV